MSRSPKIAAYPAEVTNAGSASGRDGNVRTRNRNGKAPVIDSAAFDYRRGNSHYRRSLRLLRDPGAKSTFQPGSERGRGGCTAIAGARIDSLPYRYGQGQRQR